MTPTARSVLIACLSLAALAAPRLSAHAAGTDPWVRSWGANSVGQLGNGSTLTQQTPSDVQGIARDDVRELSGGGGNDNLPVPNPPTSSGFAVALLKDGTVKSWGANNVGQLGNGTTVNQSFPATVAGLSGVSQISAGNSHALAVKGGRVLAWGSNANGQLGNGVTAPDPGGVQKTPVEVQSLNKVTDVGAGSNFSVALRQDGTVWTWGLNTSGQLGTGTTTPSTVGNGGLNTPQKVNGLTDIVSISVGSDHVLALTANGTVMAWGSNAYSQLGSDAIANPPANSNVPINVSYLDTVTKVFATAHGGFALLDDSTVSAWGKNTDRQLGDGTTTSRTTPVPIDAMNGVQDIAGGLDYTVAALDDGSVVAWGANANGQLGDGTTNPSATPVTVLPPGSGISHVTTTTWGKSSFAY